MTVDEEQRPVVVVEACEGAATRVDLSFDRESLTEDEGNEQVAAWISDEPVPGTSELVLNASAAPWAGESVEVVVDRGYVATALGEGDREVLSQVSFGGEDFPRWSLGRSTSTTRILTRGSSSGAALRTSPPTCAAGDERGAVDR